MSALRVDSLPEYYTGVDTVSEPTEWITTVEAAAIMETTRANVTYLCRANKIQCEKFGRDWKVSKADAEAYIRRAKEGESPSD